VRATSGEDDEGAEGGGEGTDSEVIEAEFTGEEEEHEKKKRRVLVNKNKNKLRGIYFARKKKPKRTKG